jgi:hypothetical protein
MNSGKCNNFINVLSTLDVFLRKQRLFYLKSFVRFCILITIMVVIELLSVLNIVNPNKIF